VCGNICIAKKIGVDLETDGGGITDPAFPWVT